MAHCSAEQQRGSKGLTDSRWPSTPDRGRAFCESFFTSYNHEHRHSGVGLHPPAAVHYGRSPALAVARQQVLDTAWAAHPERFTRRPEPKTLRLPDTAWINKPEPATDQPESLAQAA